MDAKSLRDLTIEELQEKHRQYKEELFNLRFQNAIGQLKNTSRIKDVKKTIARVLTVVHEKEQGLGIGGRR
ncbi:MULTISPECIES: 50S ribosomal protein L29 [Dethiosulfovibrio]|jgi:large subunit ribosomal protein L29|uniref:Large ribosomal subunit protein uL29 n=3 Tax=Dethiosulfovibrio TaxID=47054 RepID=D2Z921_9BACT|nr:MULTISPECIES: 50S ribosomal protein L29 [Dethiosulfovibrio]MEA3285496.1 50S ribosomal protein L29 [Synergistota bacterium]EFC91968.1 ribosomal protein L29 [Dethiosulfovibrio peptidovorans DSM 11002]MCF4113014.1 50S ribosomal protein L29 [Dethiosulfovibrio russensis]MCF4141478.1 50S ribosomal protein L29 [Dethiosulfovibrio marinus]MCF4144434.1 50S ribosomal protein L29 [Dethiosulfovibrio acidaminovorans]